MTALAARVTTLENAGYQNNAQVVASIEAAIATLKAEDLWDAKGAAATAEANANTYTDGKFNAAMGNLASSVNALNRDIAQAKGIAENASGYISELKTIVGGTDGQDLVDYLTNYTDNEINTKVIALSTAEIEAAIASATQG